jgi:hypothetical protein
MSKWILVGAVCVACLALLATGASPPQVPASPPSASNALQFQPLPLAQRESLSDLDGAAVLDRSLAALKDVRWLNVAIWQRLHDHEVGYEAEAHLQLGPEHCARLESEVRVGGARCRTLVVSDGRAAAEVQRAGDGPERVRGAYLPDRTNRAARDRWLRDKGCSGPAPLLAELRAGVSNWRVDTGMRNGKSVVRLQGELDPSRLRAAVQTALSARFCTLYLDAATLWPMRIEWRTGAALSASLYLEMEFREPTLDQALSPEECARAFTYQPPR